MQKSSRAFFFAISLLRILRDFSTTLFSSLVLQSINKRKTYSNTTMLSFNRRKSKEKRKKERKDKTERKETSNVHINHLEFS